MVNNSDAENWDTGSQNDIVRNDFVIPRVADFLNTYQPATILDVGAATGYIARKVDGRLNYKPNWVLFDHCAPYLKFALEHLPKGMLAKAIQGDFLDLPVSFGQYEALLLSFTLLEVSDIDRAVNAISANCKNDGVVIIVLPDAWNDVLAASHDDPDIAKLFLANTVEIQKIDKFTGTKYPFNARRLELWVHKIMLSGFTLDRFEIGNFDNGNTYIMVFQKQVNRS